jgi:predicted PurR-regulated permease PerM
MSAPQPTLVRPPGDAGSGMSIMTTLALMVVIIAALYFGREIFVPLALAILLAFALAPPVRWLRRIRVPSVPAVLSVVTVAFLLILAFAWTITGQIADLAQRLPAYQSNIEAKIDSLLEAPPGGRLFGRAAEMVEDLGRKIEEETDGSGEPEVAPGVPESVVTDGVVAETEPMTVIVQRPDPTPMELLQTIVGPLVAPLTTAGIVIVFVIFLLLKRQDLRDRLIRLVGHRDLPRTTKALDDAAQRVGHYLLMQLIVNITYGIPIGAGLWLIGVPNPLLWGMIATVLRFVPYIGPIVAAFFPLAMALAVDAGWTTFLWTGALFIVVELISNNAVEPWLYGASTGLSPIAVIVAAIFWTWLWGPIGLLLSTPLTVCLVVLGRHVPQLGFLDVLLGNEPVLTPAESLYQRLLLGDHAEATERAEMSLQEQPLVDFYSDVLIPALALADQDRERGSLDEERRMRVAESALLLIDNLEDLEDAEPARPDEPIALCVGARGELDEAAAAALAQLLQRKGVRTRVLQPAALQGARLKDIEAEGTGVVVLSYMNSDSLAHARFLIRRLRRRFPATPIVAGFWTFAPEDMARRDPVAATGADSVAASLGDAVRDVLAALRPGGAAEDAAHADKTVSGFDPGGRVPVNAAVRGAS